MKHAEVNKVVIDLFIALIDVSKLTTDIFKKRAIIEMIMFCKSENK